MLNVNTDLPCRGRDEWQPPGKFKNDTPQKYLLKLTKGELNGRMINTIGRSKNRLALLSMTET